MKDLRSCNILGHYNNSLKTPLPPPLTHEEFVLVYLKLYIARGGGCMNLYTFGMSKIMKSFFKKFGFDK